jgi:hypothetical protein
MKKTSNEISPIYFHPQETHASISHHNIGIWGEVRWKFNNFLHSPFTLHIIFDHDDAAKLFHVIFHWKTWNQNMKQKHKDDDGNAINFIAEEIGQLSFHRIADWKKRWNVSLCFYEGIGMTSKRETKSIIWIYHETKNKRENRRWDRRGKGKWVWGNEEHIAGIFMPTQMIQYCLRQL